MFSKVGVWYVRGKWKEIGELIRERIERIRRSLDFVWRGMGGL